MRHLFLTFYSILISCQLVAKEKEPTQTSTLFFEVGEITAPLSSYTDSWDPKQELPIILPGGKRVEEKDLLVSIDKVPRIPKNRSEGDSENNWDERR